MALGGGTFLTQNKILPGAYINFISAAKASATLSDRGYGALPIELDWGVDGEIFAVEPGELQKDSVKIFGYDYTHEKLKGLREFIGSLKTAYLYRINSGGQKAGNTYAQALYTGVRGNDLTIVIQNNDAATEEDPLFDVYTLLDGSQVDVQTVKEASELLDNHFVSFKKQGELEVTAGEKLTGGTNGSVENANYQTFLDKLESYSINALGCLSKNETVKGLFAAYTKRMRDEVGVKFQCVLHRYSADYEGVVSVENNSGTELVYWTTGKIAACAVNKSNTNTAYDGEYDVDTDYTQTQLEQGIKTGKFMFHKVGDEVRVLDDINTFVSVTDEKSADFSSNQTIRVLDQIGNDIAVLFNTKYLGQVPNDDAGRTSLWNDIVKHHQELQGIRAIEDFEAAHVTVEKGDTKKSVVVMDYVTPVNVMAQLYMTVIVS